MRWCTTTGGKRRYILALGTVGRSLTTCTGVHSGSGRAWSSYSPHGTAGVLSRAAPQALGAWGPGGTTGAGGYDQETRRVLVAWTAWSSRG